MRHGNNALSKSQELKIAMFSMQTELEMAKKSVVS